MKSLPRSSHRRAAAALLLPLLGAMLIGCSQQPGEAERITLTGPAEISVSGGPAVQEEEPRREELHCLRIFGVRTCLPNIEQAVETTRMAVQAAERTSQVELIKAAIREQASRARVILQVDKTMVKGTDYPAHLWVERHDEEAAADSMRAIAQSGVRTVLDRNIDLTGQAEARLEGVHFAIVQNEPAVQVTVPTARWSWRVTPQQEGKATLIARLQHRVAVAGETYTVDVRHFPQEIEVTVSAMDRMVSGLNSVKDFFTTMQGALTAVAGVVVLVAGWFVRRKAE